MVAVVTVLIRGSNRCGEFGPDWPEVVLKNYRKALAPFTAFSNLRLDVYTPFAHEKKDSIRVGEVSSEQWSSEQCTAVLLYCCTAPLLAVASSGQ